MKYDAVISLTSHKERLGFVSKVIQSILNGSSKNIKVVLTVYKDDVKYISCDLQKLINNLTCEIIITNEDIGPHKKYFYTMQKYKTENIITIDDDVLYEHDFVKSLVDASIKNPNVVCARRVHLICCDESRRALDNSNWKFEYKNIEQPSMLLYASGVGGVLYPPNVFNKFNLEKNKPLLLDLLYQDDMFLKVLEIKNKIPVLYVKNNKNHPKPINEIIVKNLALSKINDGQKRNAIYFSKVKSYFDSLFS